MKKKKLFLIPLAMFMAAGSVSLAGCGKAKEEQQQPDDPVVAKLSSIAVKTPPTKLAYVVGESFETAGLEIEATYSDGSKKTVNGWTVDKTVLALGDSKVVVSYTEGGETKTVDIAITVDPVTPPPVEKVLTEIVVGTPPTKTTYVEGEDFDPEGMSIVAKYSDESEATIPGTEYTISPRNDLAIGTDHVTITYEEGGVTKTVDIAITVTEAEPEVVHVTGIRVADLYPKMKVGDPNLQIEVTVSPDNADNKALSFVSDAEAVATVSATGMIHAVAPGKANITVTSVDVPSIFKIVEVTVTAADVVVPGVTVNGYTRVESGELVDGATVEFVAQTNGTVYGMKKYASGNNIPGSALTIESEAVVETTEVEAYLVEKNDDGTFSFKDSDGLYIYAAGGTSKNHLKAQATKDAKAKFNVVISDGIASIVCADEETTRNVLCLNYNSGTVIFSCYASLGSYSPVSLYQKLPAAPVLTSITADMDVKTYTEGDPLDLTGLVVTGHYDKGPDQEITEGFELSMAEGKILELTDTSLDITYNDLDCSIPLVINPKQEEGAVLTSIEVTTDTHRVFTVGDEFVKETVMAHFSKGEDQNVTEKATFTGFDSSAVAEEQTITVSYTVDDVTQTTTYTIQIKAAPVLSSIEVTTDPTDVEYTEGDVFNPAGMVVTAHYTEGKADADVTSSVTYSTDGLVAGTESIELSYTEGEVTVKTSVDITVAEKARQTLPYTATPSAGAFEGWTGEGYSAFSTKYVKLGAVGNYIEYKKCFAAQPKVRVILDSYLNGTDKDPSEVKVSALNDAGEVVDYETYAPHQESASSGDAIAKAGENGRQTLMFEGEGISGLKIELTVKTANIVLTRIYVSEPPVLVSSVTLDKETMDLEYPGSNGTLEATVLPDNAENKDVEWTVSGSSVTVVDGVVTPIAVGESTVTATAKDGSGKSDSCVVTVTASKKVLTGIDIAADPDKTTYVSGEKFDPTGMVVMANYEGLDPEPITDYTYSDDDLVAGQTSVEISYGGQTATVAITVTAAKGSTVDNPFSVAEVIAASAGLGDNEWLKDRVYVQGTVKGFAPSSGNKYTLTDGENDFIVYKSDLPSTFDRACIGDTAIFYGWVENFHNDSGNTLEMTNHAVSGHGEMPITAAIVSRGTSKISLDSSSSENATVTFEATATNAAEYSFTVEAKEGYQVSLVKFNGEEITGSDGIYTVKVLGNSKILVETIKQGEIVPETYKSVAFVKGNCTTATSSYTAKAVYNDNGFVVNAQNFNTNASGGVPQWDSIKCGRNKSNTSVATITNASAIDKAIVEIEINFGAVTVGNINSAKILVSTSADMSDATAYDFTVVSGEKVKVSLGEGVENAYYQIVFDCAAGSSNGFCEVIAVEYKAFL